MRDAPTFEIAGKKINSQSETYIIAELSSNHGQDLDVAKAIIRGCADAGANAVKLQTYRADTMTLNVQRPEYILTEEPWKSKHLWDLYKEAETPWEWLTELQATATECGIHLFSSPFDTTAIHFLAANNVPALKIASFELTDHPLLAAAANTGLPIIASTGMASETEVMEAVEVLRGHGCTNLALLKCTSAYPATASDLNLALIPRMREDFDLVIGFSDHTLNSVAAISAVALGARIIEKHVQIDAGPETPDSTFSMPMKDFKQFITDVREAELSLGIPSYGPVAREMSLRRFRRSLIAARDIDSGSVVGPEDVISRRPAIGLPPKEYRAVLGSRAIRKISRGEGLTWDNVLLDVGD